ncbi:MAG: hypothetical protein WD079_01360, partial [Phycisphaeraceae bacterium]
VIYQKSARHQVDRIEAVQRAVQAIESESLYRAALGEVDATPRGYARVLRAAWFERQPHNLLIDEDDQPSPMWVEQINDQIYRNMANPRQIVADVDHPPFWYNPFRGVVRARVPMQFSQQGTVELYNIINGTDLDTHQVSWPQDNARSASAMPALAGGENAAPAAQRDSPMPLLPRPQDLRKTAPLN